MSLKIGLADRGDKAKMVALTGSLDAETAASLETKLDKLLGTPPAILIFDLAELKYISSAGLRVIFMAIKRVWEINGETLLVNLQPQIARVLEALNAPGTPVFDSLEELDTYLDSLQSDDEPTVKE